MTISEAKKVLQRLQHQIEARHHDRPTTERHADAMDNAIALEQNNRTAMDLDRDAKHLRQIKAALQAIDRGEYGVCVDCEGTIKTARLAAVPWALTCVRCAESRERDHAVVEVVEVAEA